MKDAVIAGYVRSPFHFAHKGALVEKRPDDLAAEVVQGLMAQTGVDPAEIEDLIIGCAFPEGEQGFNLGRIVALIAELPISVAGATINRFCGSSMQAIHIAAGAIRMEAGEAFVCAGVESMSRIPMGGFNPAPNPDLYEKNEGAYMAMGETAENLARKYQITRDEQEALAITSHARAAAAWDEGKFAGEVIAVETGDGTVERDGLHPPRHQCRGPGRPGARLRRRRHGHRRHLVAADRRRGRGPGLHRGLRGPQRAHGARPHQGDRGRRLRARDHGLRPGGLVGEGARPRRAQDGRH